jgi:hypothetical protein
LVEARAPGARASVGAEPLAAAFLLLLLAPTAKLILHLM